MIIPKLPWPVVRETVSAFGALVGAVATAYLLEANSNPHWKLATQHGKTTAIVTVGTIAVVSALVRPFRILFIQRYAKFEHQIEDLMRGLPWSIAKLTGHDVRSLGASCWFVGSRQWVSIGPRRFRDKRYTQTLHRVARERVNDAPPPSGLVWTKNKGVVGRCWALSKPISHHADAHWRTHSKRDERRYAELDADLRMELTRTEYHRIGDTKPIQSRSTFYAVM